MAHGASFTEALVTRKGDTELVANNNQDTTEGELKMSGDTISTEKIPGPTAANTGAGDDQRPNPTKGRRRKAEKNKASAKRPARQLRKPSSKASGPATAPVTSSTDDLRSVPTEDDPPPAAVEPCAKEGTTPTSACGLEFHPIANIFPLILGDDYEAMKEDIERNGLAEEISLYEGKILDGRNRALICEELSIKPRTKEWDGQGSPLAFVVTKNIRRRHLDVSRRAILADKLKPLFEADAQRRKLAGRAPDPGANLHRGRASELAGDLFDVSASSVAAVSKVRRDGAPELQAVVDSGQVKVSAAAELTSLPAEEQAQVLAGGKKAVQAKVKELRHAKKSRRGGTGARQRHATPDKSPGQVEPAGESSPATPVPSAAPFGPTAWTADVADRELAKAEQFMAWLQPFVTNPEAQQAVSGLDRERKTAHLDALGQISSALDKLITALGGDAT